MNAIEIRDVPKALGTVTAVDDLSLTVTEGSIYGLIGYLPEERGLYRKMKMSERREYLSRLRTDPW
jgi:ABC-type uncharacterized transport system ATPase subunit